MTSRPAPGQSTIRRPSQEQMRGFRPAEFIKEVIGELQKAVWPSRDETIRLTWVVLVVAALVGFILGFFDFSLSRTLTNYVILP